MKTQFLTLILFAYSLSVTLAQTDSTVMKDTSYWKNSGVATFNITNSSVSNYWQAGGINSRSFAIRVDLTNNYDKEKASWHNSILLAYGTIRQGGGENVFIKNDDRIELNSKYGYRFSKKLLISGLASFRSQFFEGFNFDANSPTIEPADTVSSFLAPAFIEFGIGMDYQPGENFSVYFSPINSKVTIVRVEEYRSLYIPQVNNDQSVRYELGARVKFKIKKEFAKNIIFQSNTSLFTNYLNNPGNIDINWETLTTAKVNKWLSVSFSTNMIYDDDIKFNILNELGEKTGKLAPRTQFQHILAVGLTYQFIKN